MLNFEVRNVGFKIDSMPIASFLILFFPIPHSLFPIPEIIKLLFEQNKYRSSAIDN